MTPSLDKKFEKEYIGEWIEPEIKTRKRSCGCLEAFRENIGFWECVSYCSKHLSNLKGEE